MDMEWQLLKVNNKDTRITSIDAFLMSLLLTWNIYLPNDILAQKKLDKKKPRSLF